MSQENGPTVSFFSESEKEADQFSPVKVPEKNNSQKPLMWFLLGFGIASFVFIVFCLVSRGGNADGYTSLKQDIKGIAEQLSYVNKDVEALRNQVAARALAEDQLLGALERVEKRVTEGEDKIWAGIAQKTPSEQETPLVTQPGHGSAGSTASGPGKAQASPLPAAKGAEIHVNTVKEEKKAAPVPAATVKKETTPPAAAKKTTAPAPAKYTVKAGDTLYSIARRNNIPLTRLLQANGLKEGDTIVIGQALTLPR